MDNYYISLTLSKLNDVLKALTEAIQYAEDAQVYNYTLVNLYRMHSSICNRIKEILDQREPKEQ